MKLKIIFLILLTTNTFMFSQGQTSSKFLEIEFLGNSNHISINYDVRYNPKTNGGLGYRVGLGGTYDYYPSSATISIPAGLNYLLGKNKNYLELGAIAVPEYFFEYKDKLNLKVNANIGYRYISKSGVMLNVLWIPQLFSTDKILYFKNKALWFGIGAGIRL